MKPEVVLCLDSESARHPELIGLEDENLLSQPWLRLFCSAVEARQFLRRESAVKEVWVASSDEMDPINLAAALKKDTQERGVFLLAFQSGGSMKSRANAAGLDATLSQRDLTQRYARAKVGRMRVGAKEVQEGVSEDTKSRPPEAREVPSVRAGFVADSRCAGDVIPFTEVASEQVASRRQAIQKKPAFILSVVSACGGAGKSTVAALSAYFSQGLGNQTLLIDGDMQFGDLQYLTGKEEPLTVEELVADPSKADRLKPGSMQPALLAAPKRLEQSEVVAGKFVELLEDLSNRFDVVVVNTASFWTEQHAQLLERSSCVLFLVDQRPSSLRSSRHALELCTRCGIATTPFVFAVNRCSRNSMFSSMDIACALGGSQAIELKDGGREVDELLGAGQPLELIEARNDLCVSLEHALVNLLPNRLEGGSRVAEQALPQGKRFRFGKRRKRAAACL